MMQTINKIFLSLTRNKVLLGIIVATVFIYILLRLFCTPPLLSNVPFGNAYHDRNGRLMRVTLAGDEKYRLFTPLNEISPNLIDATILYEDKHFYRHVGINPVSLIRAIRNYFSGRPHPAGASTITMQVARLKYHLDTTTPWGKTKQIIAALYIDAFYTKDDILCAYLNLAPYGGNIEGINAASIIYFHKPARELTKIEAITLATIPQNPIKRGLNTAQGLANIQHMRADLIRRWITEHPSDTKLKAFADMPLYVHNVRDLPFLAPHFTDREHVRETLSWHGSPRKSEIRTTLDIDLQKKLEHKLNTEITKRHARGITNAAAILLNYKTMETVAYVGSANYFNRDIFGENDGVRARRSPGSTLKPLIYAMAVDYGYIHGMTLLKDAKISFGVYAPENSDSEFYGPVLARDALTHSRNIPAINLVQKIGVRNFYKLLNDIGVTNLKTPAYYGISIALGGAEVSMFELANIYATMANLGLHHTIKTRIDDDIGDGEQLLSREAFFITLDMLAHQSAPTNNTPFAKKQISTLRHYWKTGTSSSFRDAWTAGIFGDFVLVVWVGNFDGRPNNAFSGARAAAPIYFSLANAVNEYYAANKVYLHDNDFLKPDMNISEIEMCELVGGIAGDNCPKTTKAYFIPGLSPIDVSSVYRTIPIDNKTGLRACSHDPDTTHMAVYEFWDSEFLDMFQRAGIRRNTPPPFMPGCNLDTIISDATPPLIVSPADGIRIVIVSTENTADVAFQATSEKTDAKIFWFLDDDIIGTTHSGETLVHKTPMGEHIIRAIDENGTGRSATFNVVK